MVRMTPTTCMIGAVLAVLAAAARASTEAPPTILRILETTPPTTSRSESKLEKEARRRPSDKPAPQIDEEPTPAVVATNVVANNRVRIQDSQIVLSARDRQQLLRQIADAMVARAMLGMDARNDSSDDGGDAAATAALLPIHRDAFLYLKRDGVVRIGWRYPLATWRVYKDLVAPSACEVKRVVGDHFYC